MKSLEEGEDKAGDIEHVDQYGDNPAEVHHLRVGVEQDQQVGGEERHLHVHLNHSKQFSVKHGDKVDVRLSLQPFLRQKF